MKIIQWFYKPKRFFPIQSYKISMITYFFFGSRTDTTKVSFPTYYYEGSVRNTINKVLKKFQIRKTSWILYEYYEKLIRSGFLLFYKQKYSFRCK